MTQTKKTSVDTTIEYLQKWQDVENKSIAQTTEIIQKTKNSLVKLFMEIIRHDSIMHHRVQQFMIDSLTTRPVTLTPEELGEIWSLVEEHIRMEKETGALGEDLKKSCTLFVQRELLAYLITDEEKHDKILAQLERFKNKIYPYA
ncbi:MAG: hypothetical protein ACM3O7_09265 [Acidobacteriota bacterium]